MESLLWGQGAAGLGSFPEPRSCWFGVTVLGTRRCWGCYPLRIVALGLCSFKCQAKGVDNHRCPGRAEISKVSSLSQILERESQGIDGFSTWACSLSFPVTGKKQGWVGSWDVWDLGPGKLMHILKYGNFGDQALALHRESIQGQFKLIS